METLKYFKIVNNYKQSLKILLRVGLNENFNIDSVQTCVSKQTFAHTFNNKQKQLKCRFRTLPRKQIVNPSNDEIQ